MLYTGKLIHAEAFTQRSFNTQRSFYTQKLLHRTSFYTEKLLYTASFYTEELLHREAFHTASFNTEKILHRASFCTCYAHGLHKLQLQNWISTPKRKNGDVESLFKRNFKRKIISVKMENLHAATAIRFTILSCKTP